MVPLLATPAVAPPSPFGNIKESRNSICPLSKPANKFPKEELQSGHASEYMDDQSALKVTFVFGEIMKC